MACSHHWPARHVYQCCKGQVHGRSRGAAPTPQEGTGPSHHTGTRGGCSPRSGRLVASGGQAGLGASAFLEHADYGPVSKPGTATHGSPPSPPLLWDTRPAMARVSRFLSLLRLPPLPRKPTSLTYSEVATLQGQTRGLLPQGAHSKTCSPHPQAPPLPPTEPLPSCFTRTAVRGHLCRGGDEVKMPSLRREHSTKPDKGCVCCCFPLRA